MGRNKIKIERIVNERNRHATFTKRKNGLFKKAMELSILCDCDIALLVYNSNEKVFQYCSDDLEEILKKCTESEDLCQSYNNADYASIFSQKKVEEEIDDRNEDSSEHTPTFSNIKDKESFTKINPNQSLPTLQPAISALAAAAAAADASSASPPRVSRDSRETRESVPIIHSTRANESQKQAKSPGQKSNTSSRGSQASCDASQYSPDSMNSYSDYNRNRESYRSQIYAYEHPPKDSKDSYSGYHSAYPSEHSYPYSSGYPSYDAASQYSRQQQAHYASQYASQYPSSSYPANYGEHLSRASQSPVNTTSRASMTSYGVTPTSTSHAPQSPVGTRAPIPNGAVVTRSIIEEKKENNNNYNNSLNTKEGEQLEISGEVVVKQEGMEIEEKEPLLKGGESKEENGISKPASETSIITESLPSKITQHVGGSEPGHVSRVTPEDAHVSVNVSHVSPINRGPYNPIIQPESNSQLDHKQYQQQLLMLEQMHRTKQKHEKNHEKNERESYSLPPNSGYSMEESLYQQQQMRMRDARVDPRYLQKPAPLPQSRIIPTRALSPRTSPYMTRDPRDSYYGNSSYNDYMNSMMMNGGGMEKLNNNIAREREMMIEPENNNNNNKLKTGFSRPSNGEEEGPMKKPKLSIHIPNDNVFDSITSPITLTPRSPGSGAFVSISPISFRPHQESLMKFDNTGASYSPFSFGANDRLADPQNPFFQSNDNEKKNT